MNPSIPKSVLADQFVLGYYTMFTVPDRFVSASKLSRAWASQALPMNLIPSTRKAVDTFKNACRSVETRRHGGGRTVEIKVDQVNETYDDCVYQITHMVRDTAQRTIEHPKAMRVTFDKHDETIDYDQLSKRYASQLDAIEKRIEANYNENLAKVPGSKVRAAIRGLMRHIDGVNVRRRSGGIYFVPKEGRAELDSLTQVLAFIYGDDAEMHLIPAPTDQYQKDMIQRHLEVNVSEEIDEAIAKATEKLTSTRKIRSDALGNLFVQRKQLGELRQKYEALVGDDLNVVQEKLRLFDEQLQALMERTHA
jgi:hypothetical protein